MLCVKPEEGGINQREVIFHSFKKQWRTNYVLDAGNAEVNGTQPSGERRVLTVTSTQW